MKQYQCLIVMRCETDRPNIHSHVTDFSSRRIKESTMEKEILKTAEKLFRSKYEELTDPEKHVAQHITERTPVSTNIVQKQSEERSTNPGLENAGPASSRLRTGGTLLHK